MAGQHWGDFMFFRVLHLAGGETSVPGQGLPGQWRNKCAGAGAPWPGAKQVRRGRVSQARVSLARGETSAAVCVWLWVVLYAMVGLIFSWHGATAARAKHVLEVVYSATRCSNMCC